ncbi:hypothetical protein CTA1_2868 [Colletotrichum tanaceti]|uniref:Uncharacterized protein n=1 Tax=Colletotrichum tanaceti TaxID=1306861 RepID=A0A4U6XF51_9PEZI|nr:hypothetical protein CTA1_2868 [Colletotrichum tanaceti]
MMTPKNVQDIQDVPSEKDKKCQEICSESLSLRQAWLAHTISRPRARGGGLGDNRRQPASEATRRHPTMVSVHYS